MKFARTTLLSAFLLVGTSAVSHACNIVELTLGFIFAWQQAEGSQGATCSVDDRVQCDFGNPSHQWYVDALTNEYTRKNARALRAIFYKAQELHNGDGATKLLAQCSSSQETFRAVHHMIACYRPLINGGRVPDGAAPDWNEARRIGAETCQPL